MGDKHRKTKKSDPHTFGNLWIPSGAKISGEGSLVSADDVAQDPGMSATRRPWDPDFDTEGWD